MAYLEIVLGGEVARVELRHLQTVIGRRPDCDVVIEEKSVSRTHARIVRDGEKFAIEDLESRNGTYLNDERVTWRQTLSDRDKIAVGEVEVNYFDGSYVADDEATPHAPLPVTPWAPAEIAPESATGEPETLPSANLLEDSSFGDFDPEPVVATDPEPDPPPAFQYRTSNENVVEDVSDEPLTAQLSDVEISEVLAGGSVEETTEAPVLEMADAEGAAIVELHDEEQPAVEEPVVEEPVVEDPVVTDEARIKTEFHEVPPDYLESSPSEVPAPPEAPTVDDPVPFDDGDSLEPPPAPEPSAKILTVLNALPTAGDASPTAASAEEKLRAVLEINKALGAVLSEDELLPRILDSLFTIFEQADRGFILLRDPESGELVPKAVRRRHGGDDDDSPPVSQTIVQQAMNERQAILSADASSDAQFGGSRSIAALKIRSIMCVPLLTQAEEAIGVVQLHTEGADRSFAEHDLEILLGTASSAAVALENAHLHQRLLAQERFERDMEMAKDVQRGFLPRSLPEVPGYSFYSFYKAALSVGGDFFQFVELPDDRLGVVLGDVSGKGMPAALLMAKLSSDMRFAALSADNPAAAVAEVNRALGDTGMTDKFVTLLYMVIDLKGHSLTVVNAGHMPPLVLRADGQLDEIGDEQAGLPLNVSPDPNYGYEMAVTQLGAGDCVLVYTDGISESETADEQMFGMERVSEEFKKAGSDPKVAGSAVVEAALAFAGDTDQSDDITLLTFRRDS